MTCEEATEQIIEAKKETFEDGSVSAIIKISYDSKFFPVGLTK
jgi:hypothetical protein